MFRFVVLPGFDLYLTMCAYTCMLVCVCVCVCACVCVYIYVCVCVCVCMNVHLSICLSCCSQSLKYSFESLNSLWVVSGCKGRADTVSSLPMNCESFRLIP